MRIRGVLLDVDGTLVLSNDQHARARVDAFQEFGYAVPFEQVKATSLIGCFTRRRLLLSWSRQQHQATPKSEARAGYCRRGA